MGLDCYYKLPSLVDHRLDGPSMVDGRAQNGRCAHRFIGAEVSALSLDFAKMPVRRYLRGNSRNRSDLWVVDTHRGIRRYCCRRCDYMTHAQSQIAKHVQRHPLLAGG
jgi:DNA-directed RNA polymerase subunit N (RpoN/RPB10)